MSQSDLQTAEGNEVKEIWSDFNSWISSQFNGFHPLRPLTIGGGQDETDQIPLAAENSKNYNTQCDTRVLVEVASPVHNSNVQGPSLKSGESEESGIDSGSLSSFVPNSTCSCSECENFYSRQNSKERLRTRRASGSALRHGQDPNILNLSPCVEGLLFLVGVGAVVAIFVLWLTRCLHDGSSIAGHNTIMNWWSPLSPDYFKEKKA